MHESDLLAWTALILGLSFALGLIRIFLGPTNEDRMLSLQLISTTAVALLVTFSVLMDLPAAIDVALILALLATVAVITATRQPAKGVNSDD